VGLSRRSPDKEMQPRHIHNTMMNTVAWLLTLSGSIAFVAASAGVVSILIGPDHGSTQIASSLHDTYYVIRHSKGLVWPLLLCMTLSAVIALFGYTQTNFHIVRLFQQPKSNTTKA
jgi:hypothetical protein